MYEIGEEGASRDIFGCLGGLFKDEGCGGSVPTVQLKMRHILCWNVPYMTLLEISFYHLLESIVPWSLKFFLQLHHQVDISIYLTEATAVHHSRELAGLKPS